MSKGFVALTASRNKKRITADHGIVGSFSGSRLKDALPQDRLGIPEVALDEQLNFGFGGSEVDDSHLAAQAMQDVIPGTDNAAGGVEDKFAFRISLEGGKHFIEGSDFFAQVFGFALGIGGTVRPAHPSGDTVDAFVAAGVKDRGEAGFDRVVATDGGATESGKIFRPVGFAGTGHADQGETERLVRMRPHRESKILPRFSV